MTCLAGFADLVPEGGICLGLAVASKGALFTSLAASGADATRLPASLILDGVRQREMLGPTGFGQGAAIPHARLAGLAAVTAILARLDSSVDYGALDGDPVDIAVLLLSPESAGADHLKALARISRALRDPATLAAMRGATDAAAMRLAIGPTEAGRRAA